MAFTLTSTGSQWKILEGTNEEVANYMMISGLSPRDIKSYGHTLVGSTTIVYHGT